MYESKRLPTGPDATAPDGSQVRSLLALAAGGLTRVELGPGETSVAVRHRTVEEIWCVVSGRGRMWRRHGGRTETVDLEPGTCLTVLVGTHFQFCSSGPEPLAALGATMPPWPGDGEAVRVDGPWAPTVAAGPGLAEPDL